ncbi:hypothetical protein N9M66_02040 [Litoreibacter sp.]|nr:hypothetical protein [Litoreibacter sp.]
MSGWCILGPTRSTQPRPCAHLGRRGDPRGQPAQRDYARQTCGAGFCLYICVSGAQRGERSVVEVIDDILVAPENPAEVLTALGDPDLRIVSLTITEKGYCHHPATGALLMDHPDIVHDLAHPEAPRSAVSRNGFRSSG